MTSNDTEDGRARNRRVEFIAKLMGVKEAFDRSDHQNIRVERRMKQEQEAPLRLSRIVHGLLLCCVLSAGFALAPAAQAQSVGGKCGVFSEAMASPAMPPAFAMMAAVAFEVIAANDCIQQNNTTAACEHYRRAMRTVDKMEPGAAAERRPKIKAQMDTLKCE